MAGKSSYFHNNTSPDLTHRASLELLVLGVGTPTNRIVPPLPCRPAVPAIG